MRLSLRHVHPRHSCVALSWELQAAEAERQRREAEAVAERRRQRCSCGPGSQHTPQLRQGVRAPVSCVLLGNGGGLGIRGRLPISRAIRGRARLEPGALATGDSGGGPKSGVGRWLAGLTTA